MFCNCPTDVEELAERYCMGKLDREEAGEFEDHYLVCPSCAFVITEVQTFLDAFRKVEKNNAKRIRNSS